MNDALVAFKVFLQGDRSRWAESIGRLTGGQNVIATSHANGFWKVQLRLFPDGSKLRLHAWNTFLRANPHDHRWNFWGAVLQGELSETCYTPTISSLDGSNYSIYTALPDSLVDTGKSDQFKSIATNIFTQGAVYSRSAELIHSVTATQERTISLVATERAINGRRATVLSPAGQSPLTGDMRVDVLPHAAFLEDLAKRILPKN